MARYTLRILHRLSRCTYTDSPIRPFLLSSKNRMNTHLPPRPDGRAVDQLRPVTLRTGFTRHAEGSVYIQMGDTHVLCNASVLEGVPAFLRGRGQGWITAEYGMLPRATHTRGEREAARGKQSGRTQEIQRLIGRSLRAAFDLNTLGERTLHVDCDVLQADGGTRCASITGAWVAARLALHGMQRSGLIATDPVVEQVAAVSVGVVQGRAVLDLNYAEDAACDTDMNVVMTRAGNFIEVQGTAEGRAFARSTLDQLLDLARNGIQTLAQWQQQALDDAIG